MKNLNFKGMKFCLMLCCLVFTTAAVSAQTFTGPGFPIADGAGRSAISCSAIPVSGITGNRNVRAVTFTGMTHTFIGDIEIRLYPPGSAAPPSTTTTQVLTSPPDGRSCNFNGNYTFTDSGAQSIDAATVGCATATNIASGNYRTSTYGGGTNPGPVTSLTTAFGLMTPAQINGNWLACVFDFGTPDGGAVTSTSIQFAVPTAAGVSIGGRVLNANGMGISKSMVTLTDMQGVSHTTLTNPFGYYNFDDVAAGSTVTISVSAKGRTFANPTVIHSVGDAVDSLNFISLD